MSFDSNILKTDEKAVFNLRQLYRSYGYNQYKMSKFEEYDLYSKNKDFLVSDGVITFNDTNGRLLALKPDVTLSILKNYKDSTGVQKVCYNENVYRISENTHTYKEIMQTGLECMGNITFNNIAEVIELAIKSLSLISCNFVLGISHNELISSLLDEYGICDTNKEKIISAINKKSGGELKNLCNEEQFSALGRFIKSYKSVDDALKDIKYICQTKRSLAVVDELTSLYKHIVEIGCGDKIYLDFSLTDMSGYYSGIVFKGYLNGIAQRVLSGGRYDALMKRMNRQGGAIGFAVYLDALERFEVDETENDDIVNVALPKGRLGDKVYSMFEKAGFDCPSIKDPGRKLIFENKKAGVRFFWVKPSDVAIYVERGAADIGVAGKDILLESAPDVYELLDLNIGKCRMAVAAKKDFCDDNSKTLRVATKFSNIARKFYADKCRDIDIIHLNGSIEIAPILGLSDVIVDIVETGKTLYENDLEPVETIVDISARLISNKSSFTFKNEKIEKIKKGLLEITEKNND